MKSVADFYLEIASRDLNDLRACNEPVWIGGTDSYSRHFTHAVGCIVFSCMAAETAIYEFVWMRYKFQPVFGEYPENSKHPRDVKRLPDYVEFLEAIPEFQESLVEEIKQLFKIRNGIVHVRPKSLPPWTIDAKDVEAADDPNFGAQVHAATDQILASGDAEGLRSLTKRFGHVQHGLSLQGLESALLEQAPACFETAKGTLQALRAMLVQT